MNLKTLSCVVVVISIVAYYQSETGIACKDDKGKYVDWYIAYKLPSRTSLSEDDKLLAYMDSNRPSWRMLDAGVEATKQPISYTLDHIYTKKTNTRDSFLYAMYNDEAPPKGDVASNDIRGHTKGVISFDRTSGFWLIHSVPKFPPPRSTGRYSYPDSGRKYGQTFLCISLGYKFCDTVGELFMYNNPNFYDSDLPDEFKVTNPNLTSSLDGKYIHDKGSIVRSLTSLKGQDFLAFAKTAKFDADLWSTLVANTLKSDLVVESWKNGPNNLPSSCKSKYKTENVMQLNLLAHPFNRTRDHSKWSVSKVARPASFSSVTELFMEGGQPMWTCVGDINRQIPQTHRGGGSACFNHPAVAGGFQGLLVEVERCPDGHL